MRLTPLLTVIRHHPFDLLSGGRACRVESRHRSQPRWRLFAVSLCVLQRTSMNKRASRRKRLLKAGTIEFGDGAITCIVRNMSDTGALLDVATPVGIPHHFTLVLRANGHGMPLLHCKRIIYRGRDDQPRRHPRRAARNRELASRRPAQWHSKPCETSWSRTPGTGRLPHRQPAERGRFPASSLAKLRRGSRVPTDLSRMPGNRRT